MKTITRARHKQLTNLLRKAQTHLEEVDVIVKDASKITKDKKGDWTFDEIWNGDPPNVDRLLTNLGIVIKD